MLRAFWRPVYAGAAILWLAAASGCAKKHRHVAAAKISGAPAPAARIGAVETGIASWYGEPYHGRPAASGEMYDMEDMVAAHRTLPFNTWVNVHNLDTQREVEVRIIDRGPFVNGRIIDLSRAAAREIGMIGPGTAAVRLTVIPPPREEARRLVPARTEPSLAAAPPRAIETASRFGVQVGAYRDRARAEEIRRRFADLPGGAQIVFRAPDLWRVLVGNEADAESAEALRKRLAESGQESFLVRLDPPSTAARNLP